MMELVTSETFMVTWETALEQLHQSDAEKPPTNVTAFPTARRLMPVIPEGQELDEAVDPADAAPTLYDDDVDEDTEHLQDHDLAGVRRKKEKIFDQRAKDGYYALPAEQRKEVLRLHRNLAHLPPLDLARILRDAGAKEEVVQWTKKYFKCPVCEARHRPGSRRLSSARHQWEFNKVVGLDHFHHDFKTVDHLFLNMLCWGTNRQNVTEVPDLTALGTRERFTTHWVQPFSLPELLILDQGSEFTGDEFRMYFMEQGVLLHYTDAKSPWQNGPTERAGQIFKELLDRTVIDAVIEDEEEYRQAAKLLVAQRNARANKAGFSPDQRTFGKSLRLPGHMLTDDRIDPDLAGAHPSDAIRRSWDIQEAAARACVSRRSKDACRAALKDQRRRRWQDLPLETGKWVMVWRKPDTFKDGDWVGPGILLTLNAKETSCYVDMAGRLWKCSREQIRPATEDEELSAELASVLSQELLEELRSGRAPRCLDVSGEAPTNDDDLVTGLDPDAPMPGEEPAARTRAGSPLGTPGAPEEPPARRPRRNSTSTVHEPESERAQSSVPTGTATPDTSAGSGGGRGALRNVPGDLY